jgi:hypothetical protein
MRLPHFEDAVLLRACVRESYTINEVRVKLRIGFNTAKNLCAKYNIDISHFTPGCGRSTRAKQFQAEKICARCKQSFIVTSRKQFRKQTTCSYACANSFFRSGENHGNWKPYTEKSRKPGYYRRLCFSKHGKKCVVFEERFAIDAHHLDGNHKNNGVDNLIPLCANHHRYMHSKKNKKLIIDKINVYLKTTL